MKISNYSLSYGSLFTQGQMAVFRFLSLSRIDFEPAPTNHQ
jgi:hypothetical protein